MSGIITIFWLKERNQWNRTDETLSLLVKKSGGLNEILHVCRLQN